ncbi:MAG: HEPN domain-containing protein [Sedimentisphaerales bacterium]|nr:HEPN domain-containing protein [Sedimentisphaerales bacterium]
MNRDDFRNLAHERLEDARVLLERGRYAGAYYLAGYVVECGLKACIAKRTRQFDFPPDRAAISEIYVHNLAVLVKSAQLGGTGGALDVDSKRDRELAMNWSVVQTWNEDSRYKMPTELDAHDLFEAVSNSEHGVLQWISRHW